MEFSGKGVADVDRQLVSLLCEVGDFSAAESARHVGHIAIEIAAHIHHHRIAPLDEGAVAPHRKRRRKTGATHCEIIWGRVVGIISHKQIAHENLHRPAADAELPEGAFESQYALNLDL